MIHRYFAPCPRGLEALLQEEVMRLGAHAARPTDGGVTFEGDTRLLYRANLESRLASRILLQVGTGVYQTEEDIYRCVLELAWSQWFGAARTIRVAVSAIRSPLRSLDFATLRIKDAVCDAFRASTGVRPSVDTRNPDVRIHAFLEHDQASYYLDTSGEPLFKRGWRTGVVDAPLRENLAAGILMLAGWTPGVALLDPMCGGGTFLLEAATLALGIAPGANRGFGFERLTLYDAQAWREVRNAAEAQRTQPASLSIFGSDRDPRAIAATREAFMRAGLDGRAALDRKNVLDIDAPAPTGVMVMNPPYGVRIGEQAALADLYPKLGNRLKQRFAGWRCAIFTGDTRLPKLIGLKPARRTPLYNGALECRLYQFEIVAGSMRTRRPEPAPASDF